MKIFKLLLFGCLALNARAATNDTLPKAKYSERVSLAAGASWAAWAIDADALRKNPGFHSSPVSAYALSWAKSGKHFEISMELGQFRRYGEGTKSQSYLEGNVRHDLSMFCRFRNDYVELSALPGFHTQGRWQFNVQAGAGVTVLASTLAHTQSRIATSSTSSTGEIFVYPVEILPEYETSKKMVSSRVMARGHFITGLRYQTESPWSFFLQSRLSADLSSSAAHSEYPVFYSRQERVLALSVMTGASFRFR